MHISLNACMCDRNGENQSDFNLMCDDVMMICDDDYSPATFRMSNPLRFLLCHLHHNRLHFAKKLARNTRRTIKSQQQVEGKHTIIP